MNVNKTVVFLTAAVLLFGMFLAAGPTPAHSASGPILFVKKTAIGTTITNWAWTIDKAGDKTNLTLATGETYLGKLHSNTHTFWCYQMDGDRGNRFSEHFE